MPDAELIPVLEAADELVERLGLQSMALAQEDARRAGRPIVDTIKFLCRLDFRPPLSSTTSSLAISVGTTMCVFRVGTANASWRDDGTAPTDSRWSVPNSSHHDGSPSNGMAARKLRRGGYSFQRRRSNESCGASDAQP